MKSLVQLGVPEHDPDTPIAIGRDGGICRFSEFTERIRALASDLNNRSADVILYSGDILDFAVGFVASIEAHKKLYLPGSISDGLFHDERLRNATFLGDSDYPGFVPTKDIQGNRVIGCGDDIPEIILLTSGSTEEPREIRKDVCQLADEVAVLVDLFGPRYLSATVASTVSPQHIYGLLFSVLVPLRSGVPFLREKIEYPEQMELFSSRNSILVSSPAFLKRLQDLGNYGPAIEGINTIFSSGGPLPLQAADFAEQRFGARVWEIFGSTETGGIAYRRVTESASWKPFAGIEIEIGNDGHLVIRSDYLKTREPYITQDLAESLGDGSFILKGRSDSVVKIEEKRVSLNDVADRLIQSQYVETARMLLLENRRQYLGAVVVCTVEGMERLRNFGRRLFIRELRKILAVHFAPAILPRKWRLIEELPMNGMAKVNQTDLMALFAPKLKGYDYDIISLNSRDGRVSFSIRFSVDHPFYDGHFPDHPILPGVAQVFTAIRLSRVYLGLGDGYTDIPRMKFAKPVEPLDELILCCSLNTALGIFKYEYRTLDDEQLISSGSIKKNSDKNEN